jgi:2-polyprenyl-3-methyl-5-hydroxy-6-metoxy-1,4-benzoquinol methylase
MPRVLEQEVMTDPIKCLAYSSFDKSPLINLFVTELKEKFPDINNSLICDIGSGSGDYYETLCQEFNNATFVGYEASEEMLSLANKKVSNSKVSFEKKFIPTDSLPLEKYDGVISTMFLHQLPDPNTFWSVLKQTAKPGAFFMVMDLLREEDELVCNSIVNSYVLPEQSVFAVEFKNSLKAAFTVDELEQQLLQSNIQSTVKVKHLPSNFNLVFIYGRI